VGLQGPLPTAEGGSVVHPKAKTRKVTRVRTARIGAPGESCLVAIYGPGLGRRFPLAEGETTLGRDPSCDVPVPLDEVSRTHCRLTLHGDGATVCDLGSTNGTFLNDREIPTLEECVLRSGDLIHLGGSIFKFLEGGNVEALYHEEIYRTAIVDGLTQIHNRRYFIEFLERELSRAGRHDRPLSMILFDVDGFKRINDEHGHVAGDHVLRDLASAVGATVRREECFARYGGDEFALVLPDTPLENTIKYAERIRGLVEARVFAFDDEQISVTVSLGATTMTPGIDDPGAFIRAADDRLYAAKNAGRNRVSH
jgi:two-component system cell cycle response regulator